MSQPEIQQALHGRFRASRADRERVIEIIKVAFVQGRLTKDELEARAVRALAARTYADLAVVTADIPAAPAAWPRLPAAKRSGITVNAAISVGALVIVVAHLALFAAILSGSNSAVTLVAVLLFVAVIGTIGAVIIAD
jgi:Domain of unknown function (DUF1707)